MCLQQVTAMVTVYLFAAILVMLQLDRKWFLPGICSGWLVKLAEAIAIMITASAIAYEIGQFVTALMHRVVSKLLLCIYHYFLIKWKSE